MAQGAVAVMPALSNGAAQSADELREILEYERIVHFKDAVLAGTHPRVKIPPHPNGKQASSVRNLASPALPPTNSHLHPPPNNATTPNEEDSPSYFISANNQRLAGNSQASKSGKSEIDPIFLQKSDDLIKAEMNLQRVRLERALRDQIEDQRQKAKALLQTSESLPSFDISEVLSKAQALVNPSTSAQIEPVLPAGDSPADDSFDENTFYSSQHDSSEWSNSSQGQKEPTEVQSHGLVSAGERDGRVKSRVGGEEQVSSSLLLNNQLPASTQHSESQVLPGLGTNSINSGAIGAGSSSVNTGGQTIGKDIRGETSSQRFATTAQQHIDQNTVQHTTDQLLRQAFEEDQASPLIRAHNLSPLAPQPARVSPLATAREPPILRENILANEAAPAQVTALRTQPAGNSSTDSSPKGNKGSEKKKAKKKKRKTKDVGDSPESPYIKPEPRSPSPYAVAPLPRPHKRQRQSGQYAAELNYDDQPRYESTNIVEDRAPERDRFQDTRAPAYERIEDHYDQDGRRPEPIYRRIEREADNYRRVSSDTFSRRPESPYAPAYATSQGRPTRAVSHAVDRRTEELTKYYKEPARTILRPDADRERSRSPRRSPLAMGPPRQPVRIVLDEHGREYIDPTPIPIPVASRQSVAPPTRYREGDIVYERAPMRAVSSRAPLEYEEDGIIYRRASPISAVPRRVITQPEYALAPSPDYRSYREREYSTRPGTMAPPGDDHPPSRVVERRPIPHYDDELPREYLPRAQSIRDEPPREYLSRAPVVREEAYEFAPRAMSVRPDVVRYESRPDPSREYIRAPSVRPVDPIRYESRVEPMREYDTRAMSIRPEVRYEVPREYPSRLQSVRPEAPPREYAGSVRPEARREMVAQPQREYSVRPMESSGLREVMAPPAAERYYEEGPRGRPAEIAYIERPRAREASVVVYADDTRREVYR